MKKVSDTRLRDTARRYLLCCPNGTHRHSQVEMLNYKKGKCFSCLRSSDAESNVSDAGENGGKKPKLKRNKLIDMSKLSDKLSDAVCLLRESPFRILRVISLSLWWRFGFRDNYNCFNWERDACFKVNIRCLRFICTNICFLCCGIGLFCFVQILFQNLDRIGFATKGPLHFTITKAGSCRFVWNLAHRLNFLRGI